MKKFLKKKQYVGFVLMNVKNKTHSKWNAVAKVLSDLYMNSVQLGGLAQEETGHVRYVGRRFRIYP